MIACNNVYSYPHTLSLSKGLKLFYLLLSCSCCLTTKTMQNNLSEKFVENKHETLFDINSIKVSFDEPSNQELLEKQGFVFSGLEKKISKRSIPTETTTTTSINQPPLDPSLLPIILKLMNNNLDATAQKTTGTLNNIVDNLANSKNPSVSQCGNTVKNILGAVGLGGSSATGSILSGVITLGVLIGAKKLGWV